jgi:hypothetical protein
MKLRDLLALPVVATSRRLQSDDLDPEGTYAFWMDPPVLAQIEHEGRVEVRFYAQHHCDFRRTWRLYSLHFDGALVWIYQRAGRESGDVDRRYRVGDDAALRAYVASVIALHAEPVPPTDLDLDVPDLTAFYGHDLATLASARCRG